MDKTINRIDIVFENCEGIQIPMVDVKYISLSGITEDIWHNNLLLKDTFDFKFSKTAKKAKIIIKNKPEYDRVKQYQDITHIDFLNDDKSICYIGIEWTGESDYINPTQEVTVKNDDIFININMD